jgi:tetratricopeptide (TPR) repeat protein
MSLDTEALLWGTWNALNRRSLYDKAIESTRYYKAWNNRGMPCLNLGRFEEAIASFDKAIESNPMIMKPGTAEACPV